jgi:hypothetical protein
MTEMAERLPIWIQEVDLSPEASRLEIVSGAATDIAKAASEAGILDLVLLAHGVAQGDAVASVSVALRKLDDAAAVREGDLLANLTAAIAVAFGLEGDVKVAVPFGLAVRSAAFIGLKPIVADLDMLARAALVRASEAQRRRGKLSVVGADIENALAGWPKYDEGASAATDQLNIARDTVEKAAKAAAALTPRALPQVQRRFEALEEEVDILWWTLGEYSELADRPFKTLSAPAAACVAGLELATHSARRAPLSSARALLSRILGGHASKVTDLGHALPAAVKVIGDDWPALHPHSHRLLPTLSSLGEFRSLNRKPVWKETVATRWQVDPARSATVLDLAEQVCREVLMAQVPEE